jgi:peptidyl-dipeptidase Dcp
MNRFQLPLYRLIFALLLSVALSGCGERSEQASPETAAAPAPDSAAELADAAVDNPFFEEWDTPYGIPPFDRIRDVHYAPAFDRGIEELRADIAVIRDNPEPPTFENTFEALELAGESLTRVADVFGNITNTDTNEFLQDAGDRRHLP